MSPFRCHQAKRILLMDSDSRDYIKSMSSLFTPTGNFQSKVCNKLASASSKLAIPISMPGHILLPAPKGINSKSCPVKLIEFPKNLSGINVSGSLQDRGSLPIAHAFMKTEVSGKTSYPCIWYIFEELHGQPIVALQGVIGKFP